MREQYGADASIALCKLVNHILDVPGGWLIVGTS